ncbi:hypothetical protein EOM71_00215 [Candidatus Falkowbacteria bacterium]|nr:hypothetical protein [Candidatus Falkowbacteria bacterium]
MFDYLQKYQQIPADIRAKLETPLIKATIQQLEKTYRVSLASLLIKIVVKDIPISRLSYYLSENNGLSGEQAQKLTAELQAKVLVVIQSYLAKPLNAPIDINRLAKGNPIVNSTNPDQQLPIINNQSPLDLETILNKLVSQQKIFKQPGQINRWRQLAKTFLIGVRNQRAVDDFLSRPFNDGGLGVSTEQAQQLNQQLTDAKELFHQQARQQITIQAPTKPTDQLIAQAAVHDFESDLLASLRKIDNQPRLELKTEIELPAPPEVNTKLLEAAKTTEPIAEAQLVVKAPEQPIISQHQNSAPTIVVPLDQRTADNKTGKIRMDDVRFTPKTLTPIDELANLTLKRFRYLGHNPEERAQKIKDKLDLLAEYGYSKRLQGISAWRQSPLNRLYLQIGQRSIQNCQSAQQLLSEQISQDAESLTFNEFVAIMNLNKQIRF